MKIWKQLLSMPVQSNATTNTPQMIVDKLISLKQNIEGPLPKSRVIVSKLIVRTNNTKANTTIRQ